MPELSFSDELFSEIEKHDVITLFRHVFPDHDAFGSQLGLKKTLQALYPDKTILALGNDPKGRMDQADDDTIASSLAIILDCSNSARIDDARWSRADRTARIDHHVKVEDIADLEWIEEEATATCEMIALLLKQRNIQIPQEAAQVLYEGLIADNIRFSVNNTSPASFEAAAWLVEQNADVTEAASEAFGSSYEDFVYENKVRANSRRKDYSLFSIMQAQDYLSCGMSFSSAKEKVYALSNVREIRCWALFTMMEDGLHYSASLRSRKIAIRDIAAEYGGGGHECASGIKNLSIAQVHEIIEKMAKRSQQD